MRRIARQGIAMAMCLLALLGCCACQAPQSVQLITKSSMAFMDTVSQITLPAPQASAAEQVFALCVSLDERWSAHRMEGEIASVNAAQGEAVTVSADTRTLLAAAQEYAALSGGLLDITIAPVSLLWDFAALEPRLPEEQALAEALALVGTQNMILGEDWVRLTPGAKVDLGALAKGAALDASVALLRGAGVESAIVNLGGSVYALGAKPDGSAWRVGIQRPFADASDYVGVVTVRDLCVVTAGIYQRSFVLDGALYHHILDPNTGMPCQSDVAGATVLYTEGLAADAYSTLCVLLGSERALALVEGVDGMECILVLQDGTLMKSAGIGTSIPFEEGN